MLNLLQLLSKPIHPVEQRNDAIVLRDQANFDVIFRLAVKDLRTLVRLTQVNKLFAGHLLPHRSCLDRLRLACLGQAPRLTGIVTAVDGRPGRSAQAHAEVGSPSTARVVPKGLREAAYRSMEAIRQHFAGGHSRGSVAPLEIRANLFAAQLNAVASLPRPVQAGAYRALLQEISGLADVPEKTAGLLALVRSAVLDEGAFAGLFQAIQQLPDPERGVVVAAFAEVVRDFRPDDGPRAFEMDCLWPALQAAFTPAARAQIWADPEHLASLPVDALLRLALVSARFPVPYVGPAVQASRPKGDLSFGQLSVSTHTTSLLFDALHGASLERLRRHVGKPTFETVKTALLDSMENISGKAGTGLAKAWNASGMLKLVEACAYEAELLVNALEEPLRQGLYADMVCMLAKYDPQRRKPRTSSTVRRALPWLLRKPELEPAELHAIRVFRSELGLMNEPAKSRLARSVWRAAPPDVADLLTVSGMLGETAILALLSPAPGWTHERLIQAMLHAEVLTLDPSLRTQVDARLRDAVMSLPPARKHRLAQELRARSPEQAEEDHGQPRSNLLTEMLKLCGSRY
ncbi:MAG: hypothetical protein EOO24_10870 [Comamonadaceae bacterium]|nr:MAG: hypothetical protein EOO24_10870 [Comamonadaceae bacterium]